MHLISHLKTKAVIILTLIAISLAGYAQAPNLINYQGVARNAVGNPLPNQTINLRLSLHNLSASGTVVYTETRPITTNLGGLFSVQIGSTGASSTTGSIAGVNWLTGDKYLQVEIDPASNNNYLNMGTVQLISVPYAFNAATAGNALTVTTNANLTGVVTSIGNATAIANGAITNAMFANGAVANLSGTNTGDNSVNTLYSGLLTNATHTGDATGSNALTVVKINGTLLSGLPTGILKNTTATGIPSIAVASDFPTLNQNTSGTATNVTGTVAVANGGSGSTSLTGYIIGNGTSPFSTISKIPVTDVTGAVQKVNGSLPGSDGNVTIAFGNVTTGNFALRPLNAGTNGNIYVISGDIVNKSDNGRTFISDGTGWQEVTSNQAATDARYVQLAAAGVSAVGSIGESSNVNGATISGSTITLTPADDTNGGIVTIGDQIFSGAKTFNSDLIVNGNSIGRGGGNQPENVSNGLSALSSNTTGIYNTATGRNALTSNTTGDANNATGDNALSSNTTGSYNTANGDDALRSNTEGEYNTATGVSALSSNTEGSDNTATGSEALSSNTEGLDNTANGRGALSNNKTGSSNTATGAYALKYNTTGSSNTAIGYDAGSTLTFGSNNTFIGEGADVELDEDDEGEIQNATAIGAGAIVWEDNTIKLGNDDVIQVSTSGSIRAGAVTYPNTDGSLFQVLSTDGLGSLTWMTLSDIITSLSRLTTVGTITSGVWRGTTIAIANGGTGATTKTTAFNALSPMTSSGDIIYGGASGTGTRLAKGTDAQVLTLVGGLPTWAAATAGVSSVGSISGSSDVKGATISGSTITLTPADATNGGIVTIGDQIFSGVKTFNSDLIVNGLSIGTGGGNLASNIANGRFALSSNTMGQYNNATGDDALRKNTTGKDNNANGAWALRENLTGIENTATGSEALSNNETGSSNTAIGMRAGSSNTTGDNNTFIGNRANVASGALTNATAIGNGAMVSADNTIQLGNTSVTNVITSGTIKAGTVTYPSTHGTSGQVLSTTGSGTLTWTTAAAGVSSVGPIEIFANSNGATISGSTITLTPANASNGGIVNIHTQTFAGAKTFNSDLKVNSLTIGRGGGGNEENVSNGVGALYSNTTGGVYNTATGAWALQNNTTGDNNTANGTNALRNNLTGEANTATGSDALLNTTGSNNTAIGYNAGNTLTTGSNNTFLGNGANVASGALTNATAIGNGAIVAADNTIQLGNNAVTKIGGQVAWTSASDIRLKKDIANTKYGLSTVMQLRPVDYILKSNELKQVGFIAQEVKKVIPEVVNGKEGDLSKGEFLGITYENIVPILTKAIQEQQKLILEKEKKINQQEKINDNQQQQIDELKRIVREWMNKK